MSLEEQLEKIRSGPVPQNEESAKFQLIAPVLRSLGWDYTDANEVGFEHSVGGKKGGRVDIALRSGGRVVALIEAKAPTEDLDRHVEQVLGYAYHEGVDICVLTTGLEWRLFLPRERGKPLSRQFAVLDLMNDSVERLTEDLSTFLHKEALATGQAETRAKLVLKASLEAVRLGKEIPEIWKAMLDEPDGELVELIGSRVYERVNLRPEKAQVIAALRGQPVPTVSAAVTPVTQTLSDGSTKPVERKTRRPSKRPVAFTLWGVRYPVSTRKAIYAQVVDLLYERHATDFDTLLEPIGRARRPMAALDPKSFRSPHRVHSSQYFVESFGNTQTFDRWTILLFEHFGYDKADLEVIYE